MSPEQARGLTVDTRSDIWSFGCVVYELLASRMAFPGATTSDTIVAVLEREPEWSALPATTPPAVTRLLRRCLDKEPTRRPRDMSSISAEIEAHTPNVRRSRTLPPDAPATPTEPVERPSRRRTKAIRAALAGVLVLVIGLTTWRLVRAPEPAVRLSVTVRPATALLGSQALERAAFARSRPSRRAIALSPDGRTLAFTAHHDGQQQLYVRSLDRTDAVAIADTEGSDNPVFSPDGKWIAFWSAGALRKVPVGGGAVVKLCDTAITYGIDWAADDQVYFANRLSIFRVSSNGGGETDVTKHQAGEGRQTLPHLLVGGKWLIFTMLDVADDWESASVVAQRLDTREQKVLVRGATDGRFVPTGHLVYMRLGDLMASPFDPDRVEVTGGEVSAVRNVMQSVNRGYRSRSIPAPDSSSSRRRARWPTFSAA